MLAILDDAFAEDPFVAWLTRGGAARRRMYLELVLHELVMPHGEVYIDEDARATALWVPPGGWEISLGRQLRLLPRIARMSGWLRLPMMLRTSVQIEEGRPPLFWYLALVGTRREARGQGLGRAGTP